MNVVNLVFKNVDYENVGETTIPKTIYTLDGDENEQKHGQDGSVQKVKKDNILILKDNVEVPVFIEENSKPLILNENN